MPPVIQYPEPGRFLKRTLENIDPDLPPASKRPHLALSPPSSAPDPFCYPGVQTSSNCPRRDTLQPTPKRKRALEDLEDVGLYCELRKKHRQLRSPGPSPDSLVSRWLSQLPRQQSAPPTLLDTETFALPVKPIERPRSAPSRIDMSRPSAQRLVSVTSSASTQTSPSDPLYRETIYWNHIDLDLSGRGIGEEIRELLDTRILKGRDSPPLTEEEVAKVVDKAVDLMDHAEGKASDLINTKAFPTEHRGIAEGRNLLWSTDALPSNPKYSHNLTAPKPDRHYGYPLGRKFDWTAEEVEVIEHRAALPYTQPTRENLFPFLTFDFKSEAAGGVLYVAENQAVGSGVHSVASLRWLLKQAFPSKEPAATDAVAFTGALSPRLAILYIVWYSNKTKRYIMSKFKDVLFTNGPDIQQCTDIIKNILDYGADARLPAIRKALARLDPVPQHWKMSRPASAITNTPSALPIADELSATRSCGE